MFFWGGAAMALGIGTRPAIRRAARLCPHVAAFLTIRAPFAGIRRARLAIDGGANAAAIRQTFFFLCAFSLRLLRFKMASSLDAISK